jgi:hypothetical protein
MDLIMRTEVSNVMRAARGSGPVGEAEGAVRFAKVAMASLPHREKTQAALARSIGAFSRAKKLEPGAARLPILVDVKLLEAGESGDGIEKWTKEAKKYMDLGMYQEARHALMHLTSEINIMKVEVPMQTYPDLVAKAEEMLTKKRPASEVKQVLLTAQQGLITTEESIPLPLVRAEGLLNEYHRLISIKTTIQPEDAELMSREIRRQLALAEKLGYVSGQLHKTLQAKLEGLDKIAPDRFGEREGILVEVQGQVRHLKDTAIKKIAFTEHYKIILAQ